MLLALVLAASVWDEPMSHRDDARFVGRPKASGLRDAYDEMQSAMKVWQRERREMLDEQVIEVQREQQKARDEAPMSDAALKKYKVVTVGKGGGRAVKSKSKVIEIKKREGLDGQIDQLEAEAEEHRIACKENPDRCARERQVKADLERGEDLWDAVAEQNFEKRRAAIEAEGRKFQEALDAARKREEQKQAEAMGGKLDAEGNFVDSDLKDVPQRPDPAPPQPLEAEPKPKKKRK
jgi:hypothetical protein